MQLAQQTGSNDQLSRNVSMGFSFAARLAGT
jgi:hypothetical protein